MASKYLVAHKKKHIFNPAAFGAFLTTVTGVGFASWWVGNPYMFPAVLVAGLLIVRKVRKFSLFLTFLAASLTTMIIFGFINGRDPLDVLRVAFLSYPVVFFASVMLTEPSTLPPTGKLQMAYALLVGLIFGSQYHIGPITSSPETALVIGNVFSYLVSLKEKALLILLDKREIAKGAYEFVFSVRNKFHFNPGQYLEWTLPNVALDARGNRRYFTIASSPTEENIKLGVRFYDNPSKFKSKLISLEKGAKVSAGQLGGDFVLPADPSKKLVFIAGGIGITPFRSMLKYLLDKNEKRSIVMFCINKTEKEIPYIDILSEAQEKLGIKVVHVLSEEKSLPKNLTGESGHITADVIKKYASDYQERIFYISGSNAVVNAGKRLVTSLGVKFSSIVTDYFPGF
jgi:ferredoxin-NADP reductase